MRVKERVRASAAEGGCVFLSLQHQQREEGHNQFHREEKEKTQVDKEERGEQDSRRCVSAGASARR